MHRRLVALATTAALLAAPARAQIRDRPMRIGVLNDQTGMFSDFAGRGSLEAVRMAVEDAGSAVRGVPVEVLAADHRNSADLGSSLAREWFDAQHVSLVLDIANTTVALAVQSVARERKKVVIFGGAVGEALTQAACSPTSIAYVQDTYAHGHVEAPTLVRSGLKTWFFITSDFTSGRAGADSFKDVLSRSGGTVLGDVSYPLDTHDFSSFLLQAQASGAQGIVVTAAGENNINIIKQAHEFGIPQGGQRIVPTLLFMTDVAGIGLEDAQGLPIVAAWYWDLDDAARAFAQRYFGRMHRMPTDVQAGMYSATRHYLAAVAAVDSDDGPQVVAWMKAHPVDDFYAHNASITANGRLMKDMYLLEAKAPSESKGPWDLLRLVATVPGKDAFRPATETACAFAKSSP